MPFECPEWPPRWTEINAAVARALESGQWGQYDSPTYHLLCQRLVEFFQAPHARPCCSGTAATEIALRASQIGPDDEVLVAAFDYPGNFRSVELTGARPVLVDVAKGRLGIDPGQFAAAATARTRAVIASHLYGHAAAITRIRECCDENGWVLIEDACQALGMQIDGRPAGSWGDFATLSFGGSKLVSAGTGGALLSSSARFTARLGALLNRPSDAFPLSPLQAAVILPQLDRLMEMNLRRSDTASFLHHEVCSDLSRWKWSGAPEDDVTPAYYKLAWTAESTEHRGRIVAASKREGIPIGPGFRCMSRCSERRCGKPVSLDHAEHLGETIFVLDHRALLIEPSRRDELAESLRRVHDDS